MQVLNTNLMRNPANWVIVTLMAVLGSMAIRFITEAARLDANQ